jgi:hypothetical protein
MPLSPENAQGRDDNAPDNGLKNQQKEIGLDSTDVMPDKLVTVAMFNTLVEANISRDRLDAEGIRAVLADAATVGMAWHLTTALGGIKLQVMTADANRAISILETGNAAPISEGQSWPEDIEEDFKQEIDRTYDAIDVSPTEELVGRAFAAAILGILFLPLQLYSIWLLLRISRDGEPLSSSERRKVVITIILDAWMLVLFVLFFWTNMPR